MDNLPGGQAHKYFVTSSHWVRFTFRSLAKQNKKNLLDTTSPKRYCSNKHSNSDSENIKNIKKINRLANEIFSS